MSRLVGKKSLQARFKALGKTETMLREIGLRGVQEAGYLVPVKTGNLRRTIRLGTVGKDHVSTVAGGRRNVGYAAAVEFGSGPHVIVPRTKRVLFFPSQKATTARFGSRAKLGFRATGALNAASTRKYGAGAYVYARRVNHPGTRAQPFLGPGLKKAAEDGAGIIIKIWNEAG